jgi:hypothetical protein
MLNKLKTDLESNADHKLRINPEDMLTMEAL